MFNVPCPHPGCEGEFEVQTFLDSDGDGAYATVRTNWDVISSTCDHDEAEFSTHEQQRFANSVLEREVA